MTSSVAELHVKVALKGSCSQQQLAYKVLKSDLLQEIAFFDDFSLTASLQNCSLQIQVTLESFGG